MVGALLLRGMAVGLVAGVLAFGFAKIYGEPRVDSAIAFEESMHADETAHPAATGDAAAVHDHGDADEIVSRDTQAGIGLFTGVVAYGTAFGVLTERRWPNFA